MTIYLKYLSENDTEQLLNLRIDNRDYSQAFEPIKPNSHYTYEGQLIEINKSKSDVDNDQSYTKGIFTVSTNKLIGRISLTGLVRGPFQNANLGYYIDKSHGGKGYATKAVSQMIKFAFEELKLHRVQAGVMPKNIPSIRILEKNRFRKEGLALNYLNINGKWEDHVIYAITHEDLMN